MPTALQVRDLTITYGNTVAVHAATFAAESGQVTALVGPNGAGKTSILETCEGFRRARSGAVTLLGLDPTRHSRRLRPRVGVMLQAGGVPSGGKAVEVLRHMSRFYANPLDPDTLAERLGLDTVRSTFRRMSGGEQQRLKFAISLIGRPEFLFLDEPTAGMDAEAKRTVWQVVADLKAAGVSVLLTTHLMDDVERLADSVVVIDRGRIVTVGSPAVLTAAAGSFITFDAPLGTDVDGLQAVLPTGARLSQPAPGSFRISGDVSAATLAALTTWCAAGEVELRNLSTTSRRLEDVVIELTGSQVVR